MGQIEQGSGLQIQAGLQAVAELGHWEGSGHEERVSENPRANLRQRPVKKGVHALPRMEGSR